MTLVLPAVGYKKKNINKHTNNNNNNIRKKWTDCLGTFT